MHAEFNSDSDTFDLTLTPDEAARLRAIANLICDVAANGYHSLNLDDRRLDLAILATTADRIMQAEDRARRSSGVDWDAPVRDMCSCGDYACDGRCDR